MNRFWAFIFLLVPILGVATFAFAPAYDIWLPRDVSATGKAIDHLFYFILILTGVVFIATEVVLAYFMLRYSDAKGTENVKYTHGSHVLEVVWTIIPAATLLFIAVYQMDAWADAKLSRPTIMHEGEEVPMPPIVEVTGRQFEWRIRYPGPDGIYDTLDDIHTVNDLHLPVEEVVLLRIKSEDVLHSFFLPNMRIKQDVVPGMDQSMWFKAVETGQFDIVCAELCGWGHYKMKGRVTFESRENYDKWLEKMYAAEQTTHLPEEE